jgi:hypothetical protein
MIELAYTDFTEVENLLKNYGDGLAARRAQRELRQPSLLLSFPVIAASVLVFCLAPGCAVAALFLMAESPPPREIVAEPDVVFVKSDRLPVPRANSEPAIDEEMYRRLSRETLDTSDAFTPISIRGRIEDAETASVSDATPATEPEDRVIPLQKPKRAVNRVKPVKVAAETSPAEPAAPSLLKKLFGISLL